jgi:WD40 repeat protein
MLAGDLDWIVMRCLEKDRARRYQTANGLARDLQRYLADEPVEARPPSATYRFRKYARKHRTAIQAGAGAVVLLLAIAIGSSIAAVKFIGQRNAARELTRRAVAAEGRANDEQLKSTISQARSALTSLRSGRRFESLASLSSAARISSGEDVRSGAIACMALADMRPLQHWVTSQELGGVFSHDLTIHGVVTTGNEVVFERVPGRPGAPAERPPFLRFAIAGAIDIRYSPDDRLIAIVTADNHVYLCNVEGQRLGEFAGTACNFLPDNESLGVITADGALVIYDVRTCVERRRMPWVTATRMEFSPDGRRLATLFPNQSPVVYVGEIAENGARPVRVVHPGLAFRASWHPGGTLLATCGNHDDVLVWNVASLDRIGPPATVFKGHQSAVTDVAFSHGGDLAASASWDGTVRLWSVATGEPLVRLFWSAADLRFSADDRRLACECVWTCSMLEVSPGRECRTLVAPTEMGDKCAAFSPDGSLLACNGGSIVRVWNTADWTVAADIEGMGATNALQFQLDGKALIARNWEGVWRVPVIGPKPMRIVAVQGGGHFSLAPDKVHAAVACQDEIMLVDLRNPGAPGTLMRGAGAACTITISPDGNWIASGTWKEEVDRRARIWDARGGKLLTHLPTGELEQNVAFSPDGRWLVTSSVYDYRFWRVSDWALDHTIARAASQAAGRICFSPDSRIVAISHRSKGVRLIEPASGAELATLEDEGEQVPLSFSPDGNLLVTQAQNDTLRVWDLRLIERQLGDMGLGCRLTRRGLQGSAMPGQRAEHAIKGEVNPQHHP